TNPAAVAGPLVTFGRPVTAADPMAVLRETDQVTELSQGLYGVGKGLWERLTLVDREVVALAGRLGALHYQYPIVLPVSVLDRVGYFESFPQILMFATHLVADIEVADGFKREAELSDGCLRRGADCLSPAGFVLQPAVCFHAYRQFEGRTLDSPMVITCAGQCFRYEAGNACGLERLWCFTLRELVFFGDREFVLSARRKCVDWAVRLADRYGLHGWVACSSDPFFMRSDDGAKAGSGLEGVDAKWEMRVKLPYREGSIAVASFNVHGTFFAQRFNITGRNGPIWTGCVGFGLERLALAMTSYGHSAAARGDTHGE
ncbi:MAG: hypothetical protein M1565_07695, partial [Actinobacteria bacterium]|nr:hypothetical protein [Actinomycetota bacterium]